MSVLHTWKNGKHGQPGWSGFGCPGCGLIGGSGVDVSVPALPSDDSCGNAKMVRRGGAGVPPCVGGGFRHGRRASSTCPTDRGGDPECWFMYR